MAELVNLISGLKQKIESSGDLASDARQMNTPADSGGLTDGVYASKSTYTDPAYFKFYGSIDRRIVYDLGQICTVSGFKGSFLKEEETAVWIPHAITVSVSNDGEGWQNVAVLGGNDVAEKSAIVKLSKSFEKYNARYVAVSFPVRCWVFCDQLEIYGAVGKSEDAKEVVPDPKAVIDFPNKYVTPEDFHGVHDIMLAYNCLANNPERGKLTKEMLLPYTAYYNKKREITDTFFDSFLFLPFVAPAPSGGRYYDDHKNPGNLSDWEYYVDNTFEADRNIYALEAAVAETKQALDLPEYKVNVFFSILFPTKAQTSFGVIDGKELNFQSVDDRKRAVKWLIDEQLSRYLKADFKHLKLLGFYWFHEAVDYGDAEELELLTYTTDYVRSIGYNTIWIPWYQASGFNDWAKFGFDVACMQPNYAFTQNTSKVVYANAKTTKKLGMCVEMEIGGLTPEAIARYRMYMKAGVQTGYMNALHMYYQNGGPGEFYISYLSDDTRTNNVYHDTYKFVKHKLPIADICLRQDSFEVAQNTVLDAKLYDKTEKQIITKLCFGTKNGALTLANDGSFKYIPAEGFKGTDRFYIDASADGVIYDIYEVIITVV